MNSSFGLTDQDVYERRRDGRVNHTVSTTSKPLWRIVSDHTCTIFNAVNAVVATALFFVGSYHNLLFMGVVVCNTLVGIVQEWRAKRTLETLSLLHASTARVRRNGIEIDIALDDLVQDDRLLLQSGDQLCVDAVLHQGTLAMNEALLTGESDAVYKRRGDTLLSGSFVVSGHGEAIVTRVGDDSFAAKLTATAKCYVRTRSALTTAINRMMRWICVCMLPLTVLLIVHDWHVGNATLYDIVTTSAAALIGMMPQGLILLTTVSLMVGVIRLARQHMLVQNLNSIEAMARVSLVCLDKTGTLTSGQFTVHTVIPFSDSDRSTLLAAAIRAIDDRNATANAIKSYYHDVVTPAYDVVQTVSFCSERALSAVSFKGIGTVCFGAFERLMPNAADLSAYTRRGYRLVSAAFSRDEQIDNAASSLVPMAVYILEEHLRENVASVLTMFQNDDIALRVLSGDHPDTVAAVAAKAGLRDADRAVDASTLTTATQLRDAANRYVVFGRVSPTQKRDLVRLFRTQGHTVAMTGDGVNDVPALKESDCAIAVADGSDAAKHVSHLVMLDSNFASLPSALAQGRRVVGNITRTASLFLVKTVMSLLLTICTIVLPIAYPFEPLQLTLVGLFAESIPAFCLNLEPHPMRIQGDFLRTVLTNAVPSGVLITAFAVLIQGCLAPWLSLSASQSSTLCVYVTGVVWLIQLWRICRPFTATRRALWTAMTIGFFASAWILASALPQHFSYPAVLVFPSPAMLIALLIFTGITIVLEGLLFKSLRHHQNPLSVCKQHLHHQ